MKLRIWPWIIIWVAAILAVGSLAHADAPPSLSLKALSDGLHLLDNGSPMFLRDVVQGDSMPGAATAIYKKYWLSGDLIASYIGNTGGKNGIYMPGGRFWAGELLYDQVPQVKAFADRAGVTATLLQDFTIGGWGGRDFQKPAWRAGWDAGFTITF